MQSHLPQPLPAVQVHGLSSPHFTVNLPALSKASQTSLSEVFHSLQELPAQHTWSAESNARQSICYADM